MALIECNFFSRELYRSVNVDVILPLPDSGDDFYPDKPLVYPGNGKKYQVLYLLHGFSADFTDWLRFSRIETYAKSKNLAVVMASGDNSFYSNELNGGNYYNYFVDELPHAMERLFPISGCRKDKFIAGLSMGGFGSFKIAMRNPDRYAAAASLSGGMRIVSNKSSRPSAVPVNDYLKAVYGPNMEAYNPEDEDLFKILQKAVDDGIQLPKLYQCCGTDDFVYEQNVEFRDFARKLNVDLTYEEGPGLHNWDFWDPYIRKILDWLPLENGLVETK